MKINIIEVNNDGSVVLETDDEARMWLLERGFNSILKDALDDFELQMKNDAIDEENRKTIERLKQHEEWAEDERKAN